MKKKTFTQKIGYPIAAQTQTFKVLIIRLISPTSQDEDLGRQELILNIILTISIVFLLLLDTTVIVNTLKSFPHYHGIHWLVFTLLIIACTLLLVASKNGYARTVSYTIISLYGATAIYGGWHWGISLPAILLSFALISLISNLLIGSGFGFIVAGIVVLSITTLSIHEIYTLGILPWKYETITSTDVITYSAILVVIAALSWLSNREIQKSLARARFSENTLAEERNLLEIKVAERTAELRRSQLEQMTEISQLAEFGKLSQGLFHDLMTPLSSVALHMEKLRDLDLPEAHEAQAYLDKAVTASHKMGNFMNLIKDHIKQNSHNKEKGANTETSLEKVLNISVELDETLELLKYKARHANVSFRVMADHTITYRCNVVNVRRIFLNLISNAIEAYETENESSNKNKTDTEKIIEISISRNDDIINIVISDNGPGISSENIPYIFGPFFSTKSAGKGMGVGLATVKNIIEENFKGTIAVKSILGLKTTFVVSFPTR